MKKVYAELSEKIVIQGQSPVVPDTQAFSIHTSAKLNLVFVLVIYIFLSPLVGKDLQMKKVYAELSEMIVIQGQNPVVPDTQAFSIHTSATAEYTHWSRNVTLRLIDAYEKNHKEVGSKIRSFKILYEMIAEILNTEFGLKFTGSQVNNKFQTLVRSYTAVIDNSNKTGRGRKHFDFEQQFDRIFQKSKRLDPDILLTETEVIKSIDRPTPRQRSPSSDVNFILQEDLADENECLYCLLCL